MSSITMPMCHSNPSHSINMRSIVSQHSTYRNPHLTQSSYHAQIPKTMLNEHEHIMYMLGECKNTLGMNACWCVTEPFPTDYSDECEHEQIDWLFSPHTGQICWISRLWKHKQVSITHPCSLYPILSMMINLTHVNLHVLVVTTPNTISQCVHYPIHIPHSCPGYLHQEICYGSVEYLYVQYSKLVFYEILTNLWESNWYLRYNMYFNLERR